MSYFVLYVSKIHALLSQFSSFKQYSNLALLMSCKGLFVPFPLFLETVLVAVCSYFSETLVFLLSFQPYSEDPAVYTPLSQDE